MGQTEPRELVTEYLTTAPRCGAKNRRGTPCQSPAMKGKKRCRLHGGKSTGPRTAEGIERIRAARTIHGYFSRGQIELRKEYQQLLKESQDFLSEITK
jgi:hypothetical protein